VKALRSHRVSQAEERLALGDGYQDQALVFCHEDGSPVHPDRFTKVFRVLVSEAGLPSIRLHDVRHSYATLALNAGVHPKVVSERLGHASIGITLDTYSHVLPSLQEEAADVVAEVIFGGR
jgi:integrase